MRWHRLGAWFSATLLSAGIARAEVPPASQRVALRFTAPAECPDDLQLVSTIEGFLAQPLSAARPQQLSIEARIQGDVAQGYSAKITFISAQGAMERYLEHPDCSKLGEAVGLVAALAIDPERVRANQEASEAGRAQPVSDAPASPPALAPTVKEPTKLPPSTPVDLRSPTPASSAHTIRAAASLSVQAGGGLLPDAAPGLGAELALRLRQLELGLGGRTWASRSASVPNAPDASVALSLTTVGLRGCGTPKWDDWSLLGCARADWGRLSGSGEGVDAHRARHAHLVMLGASLGLRRSIGRLEPFGGLELFVPLARPRFGVLQNGREIEAFRPEVWGWAAVLGLGYAL